MACSTARFRLRTKPPPMERGMSTSALATGRHHAIAPPPAVPGRRAGQCGATFSRMRPPQMSNVSRRARPSGHPRTPCPSARSRHNDRAPRVRPAASAGRRQHIRAPGFRWDRDAEPCRDKACLVTAGIVFDQYVRLDALEAQCVHVHLMRGKARIDVDDGFIGQVVRLDPILS